MRQKWQQKSFKVANVYANKNGAKFRPENLLQRLVQKVEKFGREGSDKKLLRNLTQKFGREKLFSNVTKFDRENLAKFGREIVSKIKCDQFLL